MFLTLRQRKIFATIQYDRKITRSTEFRKPLEKAGIVIDDHGGMLLGHPPFDVVTKDVEVEFCVSSVEGLGFTQPQRFSAVCERIKYLGGQLCMPEDGPMLRLHVTKQPEKTSWYTAMVPIIGDDRAEFFILTSVEKKLWLGGFRFHDSVEFALKCQFIFRRSVRSLKKARSGRSTQKKKF